ncbi:uncharacterized protein Z519_08337 [Cladophialophora bantiana CBS 173.52]|uniref:EGF-like domain-containing protein n=1 Tax=Cladophialophora bantiana (strain ATCC 10958 / CBS 173.52 / CDC B-1940 / NIH 8579) TaxID=1442370 RepID=A0A0D2EN68_CLAB1|nr:uncharacterized protein Z519_08337 [Cladophialophora bantiana CBS 173.52]KIW91441.1 hypothetical protein Z519_08337 [Cladophialophora bantiana CBS 173.52]
MDPYQPQQPQPTHESRFHYSKPGYAQPLQYQQFPPHPSVRVPPNVKLSARQVPAGVGTAPPPVRYESPPRQQQQRRQRSTGNGMLVQNFRFPVAPPIPPSSGRMRQDPSQSPGRKYNMHQSYMSSVVDEFSTPGTTPGSRSRGFPTPTSKRYSGSVYAESDVLGPEERLDQDGFDSDTDRPSSADPMPQIVRQASIGKRARPAITTIKNRESQIQQDIPEDFPAPPTHVNKKATMEALSAAVAAGMGTQPIGSRSGTPVSRSYTPIRMPFDTSPPLSPSADREYLQTPKSPNTIASGMMLARTPTSGHSEKSTNNLLGLGIEQPAMSDKIPVSRRPPRLDMDAVREAESRGSTTSLADLIRRATKLAANLDRGKTASRLGMLDMWGSGEKLGATNRHSTMSDMLSAFPAPAIGGTPTKRDAAWPLSEKVDGYASTTDLSKSHHRKQRRKCCGLSVPVFIIVLIVLIVLIAAAVLIPIFLILVPKQHRSTDLSDCAASHPCRNGGTSIVSNDACVCVCSNGFTGSQCETSGNAADCMTITLNDGNNEYKNATLGLSILPTLSDAQTRFDIALNVSTILSLFSSNNLSCTSENSLVDFNSSVSNLGTRRTRRFIMLPGFEPDPAAISGGPHLPRVTARADADCSEPSLERRQDGGVAGTSTSNGIVFQASSPTIGPISPTAPVVTGASTVTSVTATTDAATSVTTSASESPSTTTSGASGPSSSAISSEVVDFARVVVLFVLQESRSMSVAVNSQQRIESFFAQQANGNTTSEKVDVGLGSLPLTADFDQFTIIEGNGEVVGGQQGSGST